MLQVPWKLRTLVVMGLFMFVSIEGRAARNEWCTDICDMEASCSQECWTACNDCPPFDTTCGNFTGGICSNTCEQTCGPDVSASTACEDDGGGSTTCGSYSGIYDYYYLTCGDGVCSAAETCGSCSSDCGPCTGDYNFADETDVENYAAATCANGACEGGGLEAIADAMDQSCSYRGQSCVFVNLVPSVNVPSELGCNEKASRLASLDHWINGLQKELKRLDRGLDILSESGPWSWPMVWLKWQIEDEIDRATSERDALKAKPCYPFPT